MLAIVRNGLKQKRIEPSAALLEFLCVGVQSANQISTEGMHRMRRWDGFTLVEIAIVLVIIGLLIGGILAAQSMIETVKIQRVVREVQQFNIALNSFKNTLNYWPGDMPTAYETLGYDAACGQNGHPENTNGNGDGAFGWNGNVWEGLYAFCQLKSMRFTDSRIYRAPGMLSWYSLTDGQVPQGPFPRTFYIIPQANGRCGFTPNADCIVLFGDNGYGDERDAAIPPTIAAALDSKMDDAAPLSGSVTGVDSPASAQPCLGWSPSAGNHYRTDIGGITCYISFKVLENNTY